MREETLRHSLCFRALRRLWAALDAAMADSRAVRLGAALWAVLGRWAAASAAGRFFRGTLSPAWHGSRLYILLRAAGNLLVSLGERIFRLYRRARAGSAARLLFRTGADALRGIPVRAAVDFLLGFTAANLIIRLALGAYSPLSLAFFLAALLFFAWARFRHRRFAAALGDSFFVRLAARLLRFAEDSAPGGGRREEG